MMMTLLFNVPRVYTPSSSAAYRHLPPPTRPSAQTATPPLLPFSPARLLFYAFFDVDCSGMVTCDVTVKTVTAQAGA